MDYMEKLFKQYPFIYCIDGEYYVFGNGVCERCSHSIISLKQDYKVFEENVDKELNRNEAWKIFYKLLSCAETTKCLYEQNGTKTSVDISKFDFNEHQMNELRLQVQRYVDFWRKYEFSYK